MPATATLTKSPVPVTVVETALLRLDMDLEDDVEEEIPAMQIIPAIKLNVTAVLNSSRV